MQISKDHWLDTATRETIPGGALMGIRRFLVIHFTSGATALSSINYWRQLGTGVCAHIVIDRDGTVYQVRPFDRTCGHAGSSRWKDPKTGITYHGLNTCSIGIELANAGDDVELASKWSSMPRKVAAHKNGGHKVQWEQYPDKQIAACKAVSAALVARYKLDDVIGHEDIAPGRKNDPGPLFPMGDLRVHCGFPKDITSQ
jgi:N-acetylmuramoyl-L-alanine amidase